jgi:hypothetical protein
MKLHAFLCRIGIHGRLENFVAGNRYQVRDEEGQGPLYTLCVSAYATCVCCGGQVRKDYAEGHPDYVKYYVDAGNDWARRD